MFMDWRNCFHPNLPIQDYLSRGVIGELEFRGYRVSTDQLGRITEVMNPQGHNILESFFPALDDPREFLPTDVVSTLDGLFPIR